MHVEGNQSINGVDKAAVGKLGICGLIAAVMVVEICSASLYGSVTIGDWGLPQDVSVDFGSTSSNLAQTFLVPAAPNDGLSSFKFMVGSGGQYVTLPDQFQVCVVQVKVFPGSYLVENLAAPVYTSSVQATQGKGVQTFTFQPTNLVLNPGSTYMFAFDDFKVNGDNLEWEQDTVVENSYPDGMFAIEAPDGPFPTNFYGFGGPDIEFSATFDSVPEPCGLALMGAASFLLARRGRRC